MRPPAGRLPGRRLRGAGVLPGLRSWASPCWWRARPGVGKTELAKALSRATGRKLVRLQCYEGLDEAKALYEWNYRKQLLRIQVEASDAGWQEVKDDIFGEEFLLPRPLLSAISADRAGGAADRRDRQDRPGVRGHAAGGAVGLPGVDPRAGRGRGQDPAAGAADVEQLARADRGAQAPLPVPVAGLPGRASASWRSCACTPPSCPRRWRASWWRWCRWCATWT